MSKVVVRRALPGRISDAETLWYDTARWPAFVDGFGHVARVEGDWPDVGARLVWDSNPGGRGRVVERVTKYIVRASQELEFEDERMEGTQTVEFAANEGRTSMTLTLDYRLKNARPGGRVVDLLFIRRAMRDAMGRTVARFSRELATDLELGALGSGAPPVP